MDETAEQSEQSIYAMRMAKKSLNVILRKNQAAEYQHICQLIDQYIESHCLHNIVCDWIDTTPDSSKMIRYCTHCEKTFA